MSAEARPTASTPPKIPTRRELDTWLDNVCTWRGVPPVDGPPTAMISGPVRCGKSTVAGALAKSTGMIVLPTDVIDRRFCKGVEPPAQAPILDRVHRHILHRFPRGLIVEGVHVFERAAFLRPWLISQGVPVLGIGYSFPTPEEKFLDIMKHRADGECWTLKTSMGEAELRQLANRIIAQSCEIRDRAGAEGYLYHDLHGSRFLRDAVRIAGNFRQYLDDAQAT